LLQNASASQDAAAAYAAAALSSRMPGLPGTPRCARGYNVEIPRYVELSHVLRVLYLQAVQSFQDH
jgi:hypothetical protein